MVRTIRGVSNRTTTPTSPQGNEFREKHQRPRFVSRGLKELSSRVVGVRRDTFTGVSVTNSPEKSDRRSELG